MLYCVQVEQCDVSRRCSLPTWSPLVPNYVLSCGYFHFILWLEQIPPHQEYSNKAPLFVTYREIPTVVPLLYSLLCWACEHETFLYDNVNKFQEKKSRQFLGTNSSRDPFEGKVLVVVRGETSNIHRLFSESKHTVNSYVQDRTEFLDVCKNVFITRKILEQYQPRWFIQYRIIRVCLLSEDIIL